MLSAEFRKQYGSDPSFISKAPGRVNLIGEHTDHNEGFVFPAAIDRAISIAARPNGNSIVRLRSLDYDDSDSFVIDEIDKSPKQWSNYLRGVVQVMKKAGYPISGFDAVITGNIPQGAGLSSSAAYEVAVANLLNTMGDIGLDGKALAVLARKAENEFVGVQCGIMDQFISALGQADSALLVDCRTLEYKAIKLNLESLGLSIVITNSGVQRGLVDSEYNTRRRECEQGTEIIARASGRSLANLRDVMIDEVDRIYRVKLPTNVWKRCRHVVSENARVLEAVECLNNGDVRRFGELMNQSHASLRDDFAVSCEQVDLLVNLTQSFAGAVGARITGAGFGGCTVALIFTQAVGDYIGSVVPKYEQQTGLKAEVYIGPAVAGASCTPSL